MAKDNRKTGPKYSALNSRKSSRRVNLDRREEVRFEPNTPNRRQNSGRRMADKDIWKSIS